MENIINYAEKELATLNEKEFNAVDSLILSQASYIILDELVGDINSNSKSLKFKDLLRAELFHKMFDIFLLEVYRKICPIIYYTAYHKSFF